MQRFLEQANLDTQLGILQLKQLHIFLLTVIPYENLSVYFPSTRPTLETDDLLRKLMNRRGGVCLELNQLYRLLLEELGYTVVTQSAKVIRFLNDDAIAVKPETHSTLFVTWNDPSHFIDFDAYLCDIGFSADAPMEPIPLKDGAESNATCGTRLYLKRGDLLNQPGWFLYAKDPNLSKEFTPYFHCTLVPRDSTYLQSILDFVSIPCNAPPLPCDTLYATLATNNGSRMTIIGSEKSGEYSWIIKDSNGSTVEKKRFKDHKTLAIYLDRLGISIDGLSYYLRDSVFDLIRISAS